MELFTKYFCHYQLDDENILLLITLTSAIDLVDKGTFAKIQKMINNSEYIDSIRNSELYKMLKKRGYIFETKDDENKIIGTLRTINNKALSNVLNTQFTICPTMGCNLRCTYCFENNEQHTNLTVMTDEQLETIFKYIIEQCKELRKRYLVLLNDDEKKSSIEIKKRELLEPRITLFGGEPLLKSTYHIIEKIFKFAQEVELTVIIVTNGTTIDSNYYGLLKKYKNNTALQITMDGNKAIHDKRRIRADGSGTFEKICDNVEKILGLGIKIQLRINVDKHNIDNLWELKKTFDKRGWSKNSSFEPYASPVRCFFKSDEIPENILNDSEMLDTLMRNNWYGKEDSFLDTLVSPVFGAVTRFFDTPKSEIKPWKKTYCEGTYGSNYCFTPDGIIATCLTCVGNEKYRIGTFDENSVKIEKDKLDMWTKRDPFEIEKCKECKFVLFCGGGCPVASLENYGNINRAACNDIEKTLEVYIKHIKNRFLSQTVNSV